MTVLIIIGVLILLSVLLMNVPVTVHIKFYGGRPEITLKYFGIKVLPRKKKRRKKRKRARLPSPKKPSLDEDEEIFEDIAEIGFTDSSNARSESESGFDEDDLEEGDVENRENVQGNASGEKFASGGYQAEDSGEKKSEISVKNPENFKGNSTSDSEDVSGNFKGNSTGDSENFERNLMGDSENDSENFKGNSTGDSEDVLGNFKENSTGDSEDVSGDFKKNLTGDSEDVSGNFKGNLTGDSEDVSGNFKGNLTEISEDNSEKFNGNSTKILENDSEKFNGNSTKISENDSEKFNGNSTKILKDNSEKFNGNLTGDSEDNLENFKRNLMGDSEDNSGNFKGNLTGDSEDDSGDFKGNSTGDSEDDSENFKGNLTGDSEEKSENDSGKSEKISKIKSNQKSPGRKKSARQKSSENLDDESDSDEPKKPLGERISELLDNIERKKNAALLLWELCEEHVKKLLGKLSVDGLTVDFAVADEDAARAALAYGKLSAGFYNLLGVMMSFMKVKIRSVRIDCLYNTPSEKARYDVEFKVKLRPASLSNAFAAILFDYVRGRKKYKPMLDEFMGSSKEAVSLSAAAVKRYKAKKSTN